VVLAEQRAEDRLGADETNRCVDGGKVGKGGGHRRLVGGGDAYPCIGRPRVEVGQAAWVLGEELKGVLRAAVDGEEDGFDPE
jgi:hypothetical protein